MLGIFSFTFTVAWKFKTNFEKCYIGDHLRREDSECKLSCESKECLLKPLNELNSKRLLQTGSTAGPDISADNLYYKYKLPI